MRKPLFHIPVFACMALSFILAPQARAQEAWVNSENLRARILSDGGAPRDAALDVQMLDDWHTYWEVPGDSGLAPIISWEGSENIKNVELHYPTPKRIDELGLTIFGYKDKVSFPLTITREDESLTQAAATKLNLKLDILVCKDVCIPESISLTSDLNGNSSTFIKHRQKDLPRTGNIKSLRIDTVVISQDTIVFYAEASGGFDNAEIIVVSNDGYGFVGTPEITLDKDDNRKALVKIPATKDMDDIREFMKGKELRILLADGKNAIEYKHQF